MAENTEVESLENLSLGGETVIDDFLWGIPLQCDPNGDHLEEELESSEEELEISDDDKGTVSQSSNSPNDQVLANLSTERKAPIYEPPENTKEATENTKEPNSFEEFYKTMYINESIRKQPVKVTINHETISEHWKKALKYAVNEVELAVPGLSFEFISSYPVNIHVTMGDGNCKTTGSLRFPEKDNKSDVQIFLTEKYDSPRRTGTATHELLHALGLEHEHQRKDSGHYIVVSNTFKKDENVISCKYYKPLTPFDQYSVMLYIVGHHFYIKGDKKKERSENRQMSELDKISLNMIYPPSKRPKYKPVKSRHGMYYCGRNNGVMKTHNLPAPCVFQCGPNKGPNCAACRVLSRPDNLGDRWQGRSNYVYCNKSAGCGPDINDPCEECKKLVGFTDEDY